jgi:hypothetical protein
LFVSVVQVAAIEKVTAAKELLSKEHETERNQLKDVVAQKETVLSSVSAN